MTCHQSWLTMSTETALDRYIMSEYIQKDTTTIHSYVTSPSLDPATSGTCDDHGIYPIDPIGFPSNNVCGGTMECIENGNPAYPQEKLFSVERAGVVVPDAEHIVEIGANVTRLNGGSIYFPVMSLDASNMGETGNYIVKLPGNLVDAVSKLPFSFANADYEDYSVTGLMSDEVSVTDASHADDITTVQVTIPGCTVTGHIGSGRIAARLDVAENEYVLLTAQDEHVDNGLYQIKNDSVGGWIRVASVCKTLGVEDQGIDDPGNPYNIPSSLDNSTACGHVRHGYSDAEVTKRVDSILGNAISSATHPMSVAGDLRGAGRITSWFVNCNPIEIGSSSDGGATVTVDGFGLGGYASGTCEYGNACNRARKTIVDDVIPVDYPITRFSIGTRRTPGNGTDAETLPRDWPFTRFSSYADNTTDNNITLLKRQVNPVGSSTAVGGLTHDTYDECPKCDGSGEYDGDVCPMCGGDGEVAVSRSVSDRIQLCVNGDFTANPDGTTTFKKTYVHLPAPIDTPDGDEFELTVSLPTANVQDAFRNAGTKKDLSAYYEYVSQPRVVVMGGYWKFSDTRVEWTESNNIAAHPYHSGRFVISGDNVKAFVDHDGRKIDLDANDRHVDLKIRFTLDGGTNCPRYSDMSGLLTRNENGNIVISALSGYPYKARLRDNRMCICGVAYLDAGDDGLGNPTSVLMGLHSRNETTLGTDSGSGTAGKLDEFNKFVVPIVDTEESGRKAVTTGDARQIIATVYPTATNTFPWRIVGRSKMRSLERFMTDEWDLGEHSISAMIWNSNKKLLDFNDTVGFYGYGDGSYGFTADTMPIRYARKNYGLDSSVIGSQLRIKLPETGTKYVEVSENPVRQARKAVSMLASDFMKMRMYHGTKLPGINSSSLIKTTESETTRMDTLLAGGWIASDYEDPTGDTIGNAVSSAAWVSKVRHLPEYVIMSGKDMSVQGNSLVGINPYPDPDSMYSSTFIVDVYHNTEYGTNDARYMVPCDVRLYGNNGAFGYRSVISAQVESDPDAVASELYRDVNRVAELQFTSIDHWDTGLNYSITEPYGYLVSDPDYKKWMDIYSATANVFSIDTIPVPEDCAIPSLDEAELPIISGDPVATYISRTGMDGLTFTAYNLPFFESAWPKSDALTRILRNLVPAYGGKMPVRFWDSARVGIAQDGIHGDSDGIVSLTRAVWPENECLLPSNVRARKIDDEFISRSSGSAALDANIHYSSMKDDGSIRLHMNWSAPPIKVSRNWYNKLAFKGTGPFAGPSGYIRVYMKFKFSVQSGRWYTVDYRQAPMAYLSPLYGARALEAKIRNKPLWAESMCQPNGDWKEVLMHPYYKYSPMDINTEAIRYLVEGVTGTTDIVLENNTDLPSSTVGLPRFEKPYLSIEDGGLGLSAPCTVNGESADGEVLTNEIHANFWSVRKHLRPAVTVLDGTDIPGFGYDSNNERIMGRTGGTMGDAVLWGQFEFPRKGKVEYEIPPDHFNTGSDKL